MKALFHLFVLDVIDHLLIDSSSITFMTLSSM